MTEEQTGSAQSVPAPPPLKKASTPPALKKAVSSGTPTLDPNRFRYPNEQDVLYTTLGIIFTVLVVASIPTMGIVAGAVIWGMIWLLMREKSFLGHCVRVGERQFPEVHQLAMTAAQRLGMTAPNVYLRQSPEISANAAGLFSFHPTVVLNSALVEALDKEELLSVIGHEFTHIKCGHTTWGILMGNAPYRIPFLTKLFEIALQWWSRKGEYTCDRGGVLATRNVNACVAAMAKLAVGPTLYDQMELSEFLDQRSELDSSLFGVVQEAMGSHPFTVNRIKQMMEFAESDVYKQIVAENP